MTGWKPIPGCDGYLVSRDGSVQGPRGERTPVLGQDGYWRFRSDNRLANLAWGTPLDNAEDRMRNGATARGARIGNARLTDAHVASIRRRAGEPLARLACEYGVGKSTIVHVLKGRTWRHVA